MRRVEDVASEPIYQYFQEAASAARQATCRRAKCGSAIVSRSGVVLGTGWNAPPLGDETQRTCDAEWDLNKKLKYDKTCCVHAEWNAVFDALKHASAEQIEDSTLYFMRVNEEGDMTDAGEPYCTTCSRLTMQAGVGEFALWNSGGADIYGLAEYNRLSYDYYRRKKSAD